MLRKVTLRLDRLPPWMVLAARPGLRGFRNWNDLRRLEPMLCRVRPLTMLPDERLLQLARLVREVLAKQICGDFVQCGVWRGGAAFLIAQMLAEAGVRDPKVWLFDSFQGLPPPTEHDGPEALSFAKKAALPETYYNCTASLAEVTRSADELGLSSRLRFVEGRFEDTLPIHSQHIGSIALLHIDADWYASVKCCLETLYDQVAGGGIIIIDDYYDWDGCAIALHEFLGNRHLRHRLHGESEAWFWKV